MTKIISFSSDVTSIPFPTKFTYPYNYTPHLLAEIASKELQEYLIYQTDFSHDFGIDNSNNKDALGKMFGVLVVQNVNGDLGYLAAFSGKLAESTQHKHFVPPVFDVLDKNEFYLTTEERLNQLNSKITFIENAAEFGKAKKAYQKTQRLHSNQLTEEQTKIKQRRKLRKQLGLQNNQLNINEEFYLREYEVYLNDKIAPLKKAFDTFQQELKKLKKQRKELSAWAQQEIFKHYAFLNSKGKVQNLLAIFNDSGQNIPAGAGDCCAPKLLQYAFKHQLHPICMAEFWWGKPLQTSIRKHQNFYPACTGKCKPILTHMLQGLSVDDNPLETQLTSEKEITFLYEDADILVINKPHDLLSVEGKEIKDSVYSRIQKLYPNATGPLVIHRLDMSTSGILLIAKNEETYKAIQSQFIEKTIQKRYVALLDGILTDDNGQINLPLRVDLEDRPKQLVCYTHGKKALTKWETIEVIENKTKVYFYPITGRTHQLRVHAAHHLGLNTSIVGDDLYGKKADRLYLHAEKITFVHPTTKKQVSFTAPAPF
ncbi:RluA family pseudouridine synthase [Tenacibaculum caenipelagi]|uniref:tRNA pseudouridine32 synthase/23S rRNA pseudouridine746 synthase n=1 Tax=Tenacibaculum caenipelagi TaxID=1325435 RepID=A0A4R6TGG2_9FLAO|nr:RluA family pseudouridine synthase [Tenacibaculum caenipelagi]TDQ25738.1 tRNA pseudouridine32 synthase/23S rRNA pseudouridine746 synthase [Tenacibaculum caenipelagi]